MLTLLYSPRSHKQIGEALRIREGSVKVYVTLISAKLGVHGRVEIMARRIAELESLLGSLAA